MEIDYAVLCDACSAENGRHYIHGGGWDVIYTDTLPVEYPQVGTAVRFRLNAAERARDWDLELDIVDPDDRTVLPAPVRGRLVPLGRRAAADDVLTTQCVSFRAVALRLTRPGSHAAVLRVDGLEAHRIPFWVVHVETGVAAPDALPAEVAGRSPQTAATAPGERWLWSGPQGDDDWLRRSESAEE